MPSQTDSLRLPQHLDKRRKLSPEDREVIRHSGESQRALATRYGVSRRLVQFIRNPEKLAANRDALQARGGWRLYHDKEQHTKAVRDLRRRKKRHAAELLPPPTVGICDPGAGEKLMSIDNDNLL